MKTKLHAIINKLEHRDPYLPLMPTKAWSPELEEEISALDWGERNEDPAIIALMAGLHLYNDSLHTSHSYAQQIEYDPTGAYWHGIMHRMEGDFPNAKYWFSQAGQHPAMEEAAKQISHALQNSQPGDMMSDPSGHVKQALQDFRDAAGWHPSPFTDLVQWQHGRQIEPAIMRTLEQIQAIEIRTLFAYTLEACASQ